MGIQNDDARGTLAKRLNGPLGALATATGSDAKAESL